MFTYVYFCVQHFIAHACINPPIPLLSASCLQVPLYFFRLRSSTSIFIYKEHPLGNVWSKPTLGPVSTWPIFNTLSINPLKYQTNPSLQCTCNSTFPPQVHRDILQCNNQQPTLSKWHCALFGHHTTIHYSSKPMHPFSERAHMGIPSTHKLNQIIQLCL